MSHTTLSPLLFFLFLLGYPKVLSLGPSDSLSISFSLGQLITLHDFQYLLYAEDTQIYVSTSQLIPSISSGATNLLSDISVWMSHHFLKQNMSKTVLVIFSPVQSPLRPNDFTIEIHSTIIGSSTHSRVQDSDLFFETHIQSLATFTSATFPKFAPSYLMTPQNNIFIS